MVKLGHFFGIPAFGAKEKKSCLCTVFPPSARLLIVEDDRDTRDILETILSEEGYIVSLAASPQEAMTHWISRCFTDPTDLFADTADGSLESVAPLHAHAHPTPIGVMTGWKVAPEEVQRAGYACLIEKPLELDEAFYRCCCRSAFSAQPGAAAPGGVIERFYDAINARSWEEALALLRLSWPTIRLLTRSMPPPANWLARRLIGLCRRCLPEIVAYPL